MKSAVRRRKLANVVIRERLIIFDLVLQQIFDRGLCDLRLTDTCGEPIMTSNLQCVAFTSSNLAIVVHSWFDCPDDRRITRGRNLGDTNTLQLNAVCDSTCGCKIDNYLWQRDLLFKAGSCRHC